MELQLGEVAALLRQNDNYRILTHKNPDGDTLGSGFALCLGLRSLGKQVAMGLPDGLPERYRFLCPDGEWENDGSPAMTISVDVAERGLLGRLSGEKVDLCVDHHLANTLAQEAGYSLVDPNASSSGEIVYTLLREMGVSLDRQMADCLYTALSTDTGCFRYSNTTARAHRIAADLMELGAAAERINRDMFETKSRPRLELERLVLDGMEYHFDGRCVLVQVTRDQINAIGADNTTFDGIPAITRQIQGVELGIVLRQEEDGSYKVSVRSSQKVNAAQFCQAFGGGGHARAAGCSFTGDPEEIKRKLLAEAERWVG